MIFGMVRSCMTASLLTAAMLAQGTPAPKVRIVFPEGVHSEKASMTYALHGPTGGHGYAGMSGAFSASPFEIPAMLQGKSVDRFRAVVWAPGCRMKEFDVAVGTADINLRFVCDPLKTISFSGRVKSVDNLGSATISADYMGLGICFSMAACKDRCGGSCLGPQIAGIASAKVAADGSFKMELPDFRDDPFVADDSTAEIEFRLNGAPNVSSLLPQLSQGQTLRVAASYPTEVIFVPLELRDLSRSNEVERKMYELAPSFHEQPIIPVLASETKK